MNCKWEGARERDKGRAAARVLVVRVRGKIRRVHAPLPLPLSFLARLRPLSLSLSLPVLERSVTVITGGGDCQVWVGVWCVGVGGARGSKGKQALSWGIREEEGGGECLRSARGLDGRKGIAGEKKVAKREGWKKGGGGRQRGEEEIERGVKTRARAGLENRTRWAKGVEGVEGSQVFYKSAPEGEGQ